MTTTPTPAGSLPPLPAEARALLEFARPSRVPLGFALLDEEGRPDLNRPLELWVHCRMTHCFALGSLYGVPDAAALAAHGVRTLMTTFADREHPGWFSAVGQDGRPVPGDKEAYAHAFVVLAASSAMAAGIDGAARLLAEALAVQELHWWDEEAGMVSDRMDRAMAVTDPYRGINANMHTVEAYLAAAGVTGEDVWLDRAVRMLTRSTGLARAHNWRLPEHFDEHWHPVLSYNRDFPADPFRPYGATVGHWMEWARLALHTRAELALRGRPEPAAEGAPDGPWLLPTAVALFDAALRDGWEADGAPGFLYTVDFTGRPVVRERMHWVLCEALGAAVALAAATGEARYGGWAATFQQFAQDHLIEQPGAWHHELGPDNRPAATVWRGKPDIYHAFQALVLPGLPLAPAFAPALARLRR